MRNQPSHEPSGASNTADAAADTATDPVTVAVLIARARDRWRLTRQDTRSAGIARRHGALGVLMSAEQLADVTVPAYHRGTSARTARAGLDVLWRTLHRDSAHRTAHWNPGVAHVRQAADVQRWAITATRDDVAALLLASRRVAADELDAARAGRRMLGIRSVSAVPSI